MPKPRAKSACQTRLQNQSDKDSNFILLLKLKLGAKTPCQTRLQNQQLKPVVFEFKLLTTKIAINDQYQFYRFLSKQCAKISNQTVVGQIFIFLMRAMCHAQDYSAAR